MKAVVITGVSTGIGNSTAVVLAKNGYHVFGSVRHLEDARKLENELGENFTPLLFDVTKNTEVIAAVQIVNEKLGKSGKLIGLINNAGIAKGGPILHLDIAAFREQFEVNLFGLIRVTKAFSKLLGAYSSADHSGKIINISSVAGKRALPFSGPYAASKHALEGLSDSLRMELQPYGIDVILVEPGPVKSAIWDKRPDPNNNQFVDSDYERPLRKFNDLLTKKSQLALPSDIVANTIKHVLESKTPKTRYVLTRNRFLNYDLFRFLPDRLIDKIITKKLGLLPGMWGKKIDP